jgi:hypothetical protein
MDAMWSGVVEGEPGIFPEPVARRLRAFARRFRRDEEEPVDPPPSEPDEGSE